MGTFPELFLVLPSFPFPGSENEEVVDDFVRKYMYVGHCVHS